MIANKEQKDDDDGWLTFKEALERYRVSYSQLLSMRLKRFGGELVAERGGKAKKKITRLKVTPELDAYLTALSNKPKKETRETK